MAAVDGTRFAKSSGEAYVDRSFKRVKGLVTRVVGCERGRHPQFGQVQLTSDETPLPPHELNPSTQTEPPMHAQVTRPPHAAGTDTQW